MIGAALFACSLAFGSVETMSSIAATLAPITPLVVPPPGFAIVEFKPADFLELAIGSALPASLLTQETAALALVSRSAHDGGTFYHFENPRFALASASLYLRDGRLTGAIYHGDSLRTVVRAEKPGRSSFTIEDASIDLPCGCTGHDMQGQPIPGEGGLSGGPCDAGTIIDVLVVYTSAAVTQQGSVAALLDQIAWAIADSNAIYAGSGIGLRVRLVGTSSLPGYVENANMSVDLNRLTAVADGWIDGVHALRNSVGADLVVMVRADGGGACGTAWLLPTNSSAEAANGFSVTALGCFSNRTFTHEMGHNMGCCHAPGDGGGCLAGGVFAYSVGHRFNGLDGLPYRTVMAYSPGTRIPRFSSPSVAWAGVPTGIAGMRDNARTINETGLAVSNFRCSADGVGSCGSGGGCYAAHAAPGCNDSSCCVAVCAVDSYCCLNQWDAVCVEEALALCSDCGEAGAGSCFVSHASPSCNDSACCASVCSIDPYCCTTSWDSICSGEAITLCPNCGDAETGSCYVVHAGRFCDNAVCCESVCALDPYCCATSWDHFCVARAVESCAGCGNPNAGSCYAAHAAPYCADAACCANVCAADVYCCNTSWDSLCANAAIANCPACGNPSAGDCYTPHVTPFCVDAACCANVCGTDPFCCATAWDALCASEADLSCPHCGSSNAGDCYTPHATPFCVDATCCTTVCGFDPYCCNTAWDSICASEAITSCPDCGNPSAGSCYLAHAAPFCATQACCDAVCAVDSYCCNTSWDSICANEAAAMCPGCGNPSAGSCTVVHASAYCQDATCCSQVCAADAYCCNVQWDSLCVSGATTLCVNTCGGSLANDCCVAHVNPSCNDAVCCSAVCAIDSYCCNNSWDSICANEARVMCKQCCATDLNFDGITDAADLSILLSGWGGSGGDCNGDGTTNAADLAQLLNAWGPCS